MPQNFQLGRLPRALLKGDKSKDENNFKPGVWYTVDPFDIKTSTSSVFLLPTQR